MKQKCQECEEEVRGLHLDPRRPPLDTEPCLCASCSSVAINEVIDGHAHEIIALADMLCELVPDNYSKGEGK